MSNLMKPYRLYILAILILYILTGGFYFLFARPLMLDASEATQELTVQRQMAQVTERLLQEAIAENASDDNQPVELTNYLPATSSEDQVLETLEQLRVQTGVQIRRASFTQDNGLNETEDEETAESPIRALKADIACSGSLDQILSFLNLLYEQQRIYAVGPFEYQHPMGQTADAGQGAIPDEMNVQIQALYLPNP